MTESELSEEYELCLRFLLHLLVNIGATSHVKNNLNMVGVGYTAQNLVWHMLFSFRSYITSEHTQKLEWRF